jgi:hypothetical protein
MVIMLTPKILEYQVYLHTDEWIGLADSVINGTPVADRRYENDIEFWYHIEWRGYDQGAWAIFRPEDNSSFCNVEEGELFWSDNRKAIYRKVGLNAVNMVTLETDYGFYPNVVTGGPAVESDIETVRQYKQPTPTPNPLLDRNAKWRKDPATEKQIAKIRELGGDPSTVTTKGEASDLIESLVPSCHYCGQPATGFGFFDEYVCHDCGGPAKITL